MSHVHNNTGRKSSGKPHRSRTTYRRPITPNSWIVGNGPKVIVNDECCDDDDNNNNMRQQRGKSFTFESMSLTRSSMLSRAGVQVISPKNVCSGKKKKRRPKTSVLNHRRSRGGSKSPSLSLQVLEQVMLPTMPVHDDSIKRAVSMLENATSHNNEDDQQQQGQDGDDDNDSNSDDDDNDDDDEEEYALQTAEEAIAFFARYGSTTSLKFVYCVPRTNENDDNYSPYDLRVVKRSELRDHYYTISPTGVVHVQQGQPSEFISLGDWLHQTTTYKILRGLKYFREFRVTKSFRTWRSNVRYNLYCRQRATLQKRLFRCRPIFAEALRKANAEIQWLKSVRMIHLGSAVLTTEEFASQQLGVRATASTKFENVYNNVLSIVEEVCQQVQERCAQAEAEVEEDRNQTLTWNFALEEARMKSMAQVRFEKEERANRLKSTQYELRILVKFVRFVNTMFRDALITTCIDTCMDFSETLHARKRPLLKLEVHIDDDGIQMVPSLDRVTSLIDGMMELNISTISSVPLLFDDERIRQFECISRGDMQIASVDTCLQNNDAYQRSYAKVQECISGDFNTVVTSASHLEDMRCIFVFGKRWNSEVYASKEHTATSLDADMKQQASWKSEVERNVRIMHTASTFQVSTTVLKEDLLSIIHGATEVMKQQCLELYNQGLKEIQLGYTTQLRELEDSPTSLNEFAVFVEKIRAVRDTGEQLAQQTATTNQLQHILNKFQVRISHAFAVMSDDIRVQADTFEQRLRITESMIDDKMMTMRQQVNVEISRLNRELAEHKESLCSGMFVSTTEEASVVLEELESVRGTLDAIRQRTIVLQGYQVLFGIDPYPFKLLPQVELEFSNRLTFWTRYNEWQASTTTWDTENFRHLDVERMNNSVNRMWRYTNKVVREAEKANTENLQCALQFLQSVREWHSIMPTVLELGNRAMKASHWRQLFEQLNQVYFADAAIKLRKLRVIGVFKQRELVTKVVEAAVGEHVLFNSLARIERTWESMQLLVVPYTNTTNTTVEDAASAGDTPLILGSVDEVLESLEEHEATLKTMLLSPHVNTLFHQICTWQSRLQELSSLLDSWLTFQRLWMYLEPVFTVDGIEQQMPSQTATFNEVNQFWRLTMLKVSRNRRVLAVLSIRNLCQDFTRANSKLEHIARHLGAYLEMKRRAFPRLYFLSDDELLSILSHAHNSTNLVTHLPKLFESIVSLTFSGDSVTSIHDGHGESVELIKGVNSRAAPEEWLKSLDVQQRATVARLVSHTLSECPLPERMTWLISRRSEVPAQVALVVDSVMWAQEVERAFLRQPFAVRHLHDTMQHRLDELVSMIDFDGDTLQQRLLQCLIVQTIHHRDVTAVLDEHQCASCDVFEWQKQLRYYYCASNDDDGRSNVTLRHLDNKMQYGNEYLGTSPRMVMTPLTERALITMTQALTDHCGVSLVGPAGTGKTGTVKELGYALAVPTLTFNCSESLDTNVMARLLAGVASVGALACFDELNMVETEVLSVVSQQIACIQTAVLSGNVKQVEFGDRFVDINRQYGIFATMNPQQYTGRSKLPENLKALLRPVAMMAPDALRIVEVTLLSQGFANAQVIATKLVTLYELAQQQLSHQDHYDFGLRAMKSALVLAGQMRSSQVDEQVTLVNAVRHCNIPKFKADDVPKFDALLVDLFPMATNSMSSSSRLRNAIHNSFLQSQLQPGSLLLEKTEQLSVTMSVRHGVMLVGETGSGRSTCVDMLAVATTNLGQPVNITRLNPLSTSLKEFYGHINEASGEWTDGLLPFHARELVSRAHRHPNSLEWLILDSPVDSAWVENLNTLLDDSKLLCLTNGERIRIPQNVSILFETTDLAHAMPSTISRCGMLYFEAQCLDWRPLVTSWEQRSADFLPLSVCRHIGRVLHDVLGSLIEYSLQHTTLSITATNLAISCLRMLDGLLVPEMGVEWTATTSDMSHDDDEVLLLSTKFTLVSLVWSIGGVVPESARYGFHELFVRVCKPHTLNVWPSEILDDEQATWFDICIDHDTFSWSVWCNTVSSSTIATTTSTHLCVPTVQICQVRFVMDTILRGGRHHFLLSGGCGVGKTTALQYYFSTSCETNMDFHTVSTRIVTGSTVQQLCSELRAGLVARRKRSCSKMVVMIDDLHMTTPENGGRPCLQLLRHIMNTGGYHDTTNMHFQHVDRVQFVGTYSPSIVNNRRFNQRFQHMWLLEPTDETLSTIFTHTLSSFVQDIQSSCDTVSQELMSVVSPLVIASIRVHRRMCAKFRQGIQSDFHYVFGARTLTQLFSGMAHVSLAELTTNDTLVHLWHHEAARVYRDRLATDEECVWFDDMIYEELRDAHKRDNQVLSIARRDLEDTLFTDIAVGTHNNHSTGEYVQCTDLNEIEDALYSLVCEYNTSFMCPLSLVFFEDAIYHACRVSRVLAQPEGHVALLGTANGRTSIARLAAFSSGYACVSIDVSVENYSVNEWHDALNQMLLTTGVDQKPIVFIVREEQLVLKEMLRDINWLLTRGCMQQLIHRFGKDSSHKDALLARLRAVAQDEQRPTDSVSLWSQFTNGVRRNLHFVFLFTPTSSMFGQYSREYPALVTHTTVDYFRPWSDKSLYSVARHLLAGNESDHDIDESESRLRHAIGKLCTSIHKSAIEAANVKYNDRHDPMAIHVPSVNAIRLLSTFHHVYDIVQGRVEMHVSRYFGGANKLSATKRQVSLLKAEMLRLQPQLEEGAAALEVIVGDIQRDAECVKELAKVCETETHELALDTERVRVIKDDCQKAIDAVLPQYEAAVSALQTLKKEHVTMLKTFNNPPPAVKTVMEGVCLLFNRAPTWEEAQKLVTNVKFLSMCRNYDKDSIPLATSKRLRRFIEDSDFPSAEKLATVSEAVVSLSCWVCSMNDYTHAMRKLEPRRAELVEAEHRLAASQQVLDEKHAEMSKLNQHLAQLKETHTTKSNELVEVRERVEALRQRASRAEAIMNGLASEHERWSGKARQLQVDAQNITGNSLIAAACITYFGPFSAVKRAQLLKVWIRDATNLNISVNDDFTLSTILADTLTLRSWATKGLPSDAMSIENALICTNTMQWPLLVDPQMQARSWLTAQLPNLVILDANNLDVSAVQRAVEFGENVLIENVESIHSSIVNLVNQRFVRKDDEVLVRVGERNVPYNNEFALYLRNESTYVVFEAGVYAAVSVIDFSIAPETLRQQMLTAVCKSERPDLVQSHHDMMCRLARDRSELETMEQNVLDMISASEGNLLDDDALVNMLQTSITAADELNTRVAQTVKTVKEIVDMQFQYYEVAVRASDIYDTLTRMHRINSMYQYSLSYFMRLFHHCLSDESSEAVNVKTRVRQLCQVLTTTVKNIVLGGVFECDKLAFLMLLSTIVDSVPWKLWQHFLHYRNRDVDIDALHTILDNHHITPPTSWNDPVMKHMKPFVRVLVVQAFLRADLVYAMEWYVDHILGNHGSGTGDIHDVIEYTTCEHPLVIFVSEECNARSTIDALAQQYEREVRALTLGHGQLPRARQLIIECAKNGYWVYLENCHLMPNLDFLNDHQVECHTDFRMVLSTSARHHHIPSHILRHATKLTITTPTDMYENILQLFTQVPRHMYSGSDTHNASLYRQLLWGVAWFHAVILARKRYDCGWNETTYPWTLQNFLTSQHIIHQHLCNTNTISIERLLYLVGDVTYGGCIIDNHDKHLLSTLLSRILCRSYVQGELKASVFGEFTSMLNGPLPLCIEDVPSYISVCASRNPVDHSRIPIHCGLHESAMYSLNANAVSQCLTKLQDAQSAIILMPKPQLITGYTQTIQQDLQEMAHYEDDSDLSDHVHHHMKHELSEYKNVLNSVLVSLSDMSAAINGDKVATNELIDTYSAVLNDQVPRAWNAFTFIGCKSLKMWLSELHSRVMYVYNWLHTRNTNNHIRLSMLNSPHALLTSIRQNMAHHSRIPLNDVSLDVRVKSSATTTTTTSAYEFTLDGIRIVGGYKFDGERLVSANVQSSELHDGLQVVAIRKQQEQHHNDTAIECPLYTHGIRSDSTLLCRVRIPCADPLQCTERNVTLMTNQQQQL